METTVPFNVRPHGTDVVIIDVRGEVTSASEHQLMEAYGHVGNAARIVLNFESLDYMNSSGIGLLVTLLIRAQRNGQHLHACGLSDHYRQILALTRLDEAISVHDTEDAAIGAAQQRGVSA